MKIISTIVRDSEVWDHIVEEVPLNGNIYSLTTYTGYADFSFSLICYLPIHFLRRHSGLNRLLKLLFSGCLILFFEWMIKGHRTQWSCGLIHYVIDREVGGPHLTTAKFWVKNVIGSSFPFNAPLSLYVFVALFTSPSDLLQALGIG